MHNVFSRLDRPVEERASLLLPRSTYGNPREGGGMSPERKFYVYAHRKASDGNVFYIGKGSGHRSTSVTGRNIYWRRISEKHGWKSSIIFKNLTECCALSIERIFISILHGKLSNMTIGGSGPTGYKHTQSAKNAMSKAKKGIPKKTRTAQHRAAIAKVHCIPVATDKGEIFKSGKDAAKFLKENGYPTASRGNISSCINGKMKSCYGRKWVKAEAN
jgi:hypothetical protein